MVNILSLINDAAKSDPKSFIAECEANYKNQVSAAAERIADNDDIKIVAIAGPSGSGKTTTAHILMRELEALGEKTAVVSLDDFYLPFEKMPIGPDGERDIESVSALDIPRIEKAFSDIVNNGRAYLPRFDFLTKSRIENASEINIGHRGIAIVEGLHAMNPMLTDGVARKNILKIYISVNLPIESEDGEPVLTSRQLRLVRRILRDEKFRGASAEETLYLWNNVIGGESKYLYCFKNTADIKLTTLHAFEPCVYKDEFCKMRAGVGVNTPCYEYFIKTANALELFCGISSDFVPENSLIREFIGPKR